jgi:hypothetical protein
VANVRPKLKQQFAFSLHPESTEIVRQWLKANGQTLSGWLTLTLDEWAKEIQGQPSVLSKRPDEMTLKEFGDVLSYWWKAASESSEDE